jgi:hypothetical protein
MSITLTLTADETNGLHDVLSNWIDQFEDGRLQDCETDPEMAEIWMPMYDGALRAIQLIEAETTEQIIEGGAK